MAAGRGCSLAGLTAPSGRTPHSLRHTVARSYLVNGGDVFSLQRILGHTTLDMVKGYVALAEVEIVRRLHAVASPVDRLLIGPKVSVILPRAVFGKLSEIGDRTQLTVEQHVGAAAEPFGNVAARSAQLRGDGLLTTCQERGRGWAGG